MLIRTSALVKRYRMGNTDVYAFAGVSIDIAKRDLVAITGPSESGKSTFMRELP